MILPKSESRMKEKKRSCERKRSLCIVLVLAVLMLLAALYGSFWASKHLLQITRYEIVSDKLSERIRIVQLSDLHCSEFGEGNADLIARTAEQEPDLIVMTGDMINGNSKKMETTQALITALSEIAPVYASFGNHERANERVYRSDMTKWYEEAGAVVLEKTYQDIEIRGQRIRLGGFLGYGLPERYAKFGEAIEAEYTYIEEMQKTEDLKVLLCHYPTCWIKDGLLDDWDVDVVFSGHEHGGQIRLPWLGGGYAPDRGFFPGYTSGVMTAQDGKRALVISRGLGSTGSIPRLNNVPEIVVMDITAENSRSQ